MEERGERPEAGHWVSGYVKANVNNGASRKEWESRYKKESGGKTLIHLCVLFPPHQHLHCHFKMAFSAWIKKNINNYNL